MKNPPSSDIVTVVSGMPRSGTSLMMRMLEAGGIPVLSDGRRPADEHNPYGYFEDERTMRLAKDAAWIEEARGRAVKVIYRLLRNLPAHLEYRILFMERDLNEVYDSQQDMLRARNDGAAAQDRNVLIRALAQDLESARQWMARQRNMRYLAVSYAELIRNPRPLISQIAQFLDRAMDEGGMAAAVDPALYRHRCTL